MQGKQQVPNVLQEKKAITSSVNNIQWQLILIEIPNIQFR